MTAPPTGTHIAYYHLCQRKLWLFANGIHMEHNSDLVYAGKLIGETTYERRHKRYQEVDLGHIKIDFFDQKEKKIHEIKKSNKMESAHEWQVKYYIWEMQKAGITVTSACLEYPKLKLKKEILLSSTDIEYLKETIKKIHTILSQSDSPPLLQKPICRKCSYYDFCYANE